MAQLRNINHSFFPSPCEALQPGAESKQDFLVYFSRGKTPLPEPNQSLESQKLPAGIAACDHIRTPADLHFLRAIRNFGRENPTSPHTYRFH